MENIICSVLSGIVDMKKPDFINLGYIHQEDTVYFEIYVKSGEEVFSMPEDVEIELVTVNKRKLDAPIVKQTEGIYVDVALGKIYGFLPPEAIEESGCIYGQLEIKAKGKVKTPIFHFEIGRTIEGFANWD